jgi:hypothetical protein
MILLYKFVLSCITINRLFLLQLTLILMLLFCNETKTHLIGHFKWLKFALLFIVLFLSLKLKITDNVFHSTTLLLLGILNHLK